jgi:hypothetical protein
MHKGAFRVCLNNIIIIVSAILLSSCATPTKNGNAGFQPSKAEIRNPGTIVLPKSFESVWYRAGTKGFSLIAYLASGNLVINDNNIEFESDDESFKINIKDVHSISWGKMSGDTFNDWSIIKYGEPEKIIGFKDGSKLGWGTDTDLFYSTLKYAVEVVGGHSPTIEPPFASGWIDITFGGLIATDTQELQISVNLINKTEDKIWLKVEFLKPSLSSACREEKMLGSRVANLFRCPQESITSNQFYPIYISVFLDKNLSELVEKSGTSMRFSEEVIEAINSKLVVAGTRPSTTTNSTHEIDVPGTAANAQLQNDITQKLIEEASKNHGDCGHIVLKADAYKATEPSVIVIEMGGDAPALAKSLRAKDLMFVEKWFLKSCETVNIYEVLLWKSGTGTDIMVKRLDTGE